MNEQKIKEFILPKVQKFIDKVESDQAKNVETYQDMKDIKRFLESLDLSHTMQVDGIVFTRDLNCLYIDFKVDMIMQTLRISWENAKKMAEIMRVLFPQAS